MKLLPSPPRRGSGWRRHFLALAGLLLLAGCANGDFQEVRPILVSDNIHDWIGPDAAAWQGTTAPSHFRLTDDERELRDLAYPLIEPPYDRHQWYSVLGEYGAFGVDHREPFNRAAYLNRLLSSYYRSPSARYAKLTDDIRNDSTRLPQFFETAARVIDIDQKRRASLAYIPDLSPYERKNALRRINENAAIVTLVATSLHQRIAAYRFALERLVVMTPTAQAADAEHLLNKLQAQVTRYSFGSLPIGAPARNLASAR